MVEDVIVVVGLLWNVLECGVVEAIVKAVSSFWDS